MSEKNQLIKHIAVAGNIGAGKPTLSEMLSNHYNWTVLYEDTSTNPYLSDFYNEVAICMELQIIGVGIGKSRLLTDIPRCVKPLLVSYINSIYRIWRINLLDFLSIST